MATGSLCDFSDSSFSDDVVKSQLPVVVDFWAEWCGPCKMLTPIVTQLAAEFDGKVKIGKVNIDNNPQVAAKYNIVSIPTLLFFKDGTIVDQHTGLLALPALKNKISKLFGI